MAATFEFVGKLKKIEKETEKFKAFEEKRYDSGWTNQTFKFNAINGNNSHIMQIRAGFWSRATISSRVKRISSSPLPICTTHTCLPTATRRRKVWQG